MSSDGHGGGSREDFRGLRGAPRGFGGPTARGTGSGAERVVTSKLEQGGLGGNGHKHEQGPRALPVLLDGFVRRGFSTGGAHGAIR